MSDYRFPAQDARFVMQHLLDFPTLCNALGQQDLNSGLGDAILDEAARLGSEVLAPLNRVGDQQGATLTEDGVSESPGFKEAYRQFVENGWPSLSGPTQWGGQGLPKTLATAVMENWQSANMAFSLCPLLTQGAVEALAHHADSALQQVFLAKMISGEWAATMNLTEPDAGSDLAAIKTRAEPAGEHFKLYGQKIFITWGDHQLTDNIVHLVLARLPDAPPGVKGISLFVVPKFLVNSDGSLGVRNDVNVVSIEHKLGIHGSPTCVMSFGEQSGAVGYLVGQPHTGLACMFTMMNDARQGVGLQGLALSERAYQHALGYAKERLQGTLSDGRRVAIIQHADVRRMLLLMKAGSEAMRALVYQAAACADQVQASTAETRPSLQKRLDLYTPIVKGWMTELAQELTSLGVQIHGGMGFVEETGAAQFYRDARILPIYEGTTAIQALDLVGRKGLADQGEGLQALLDDIAADLAGLSLPADLQPALQATSAAEQAGRNAVNWILENPRQAGAVSVNLMMLLGYLCGGWLMLKSAAKAYHLQQSDDQDQAFMQAKQVSARFYCEHFIPRVQAHWQTIKAGAETILALDDTQF